MAWIYLAESADSPALWNPTSFRSPTVKTNLMPKPYSYLECMMGRCPSLRSGMTCEHLMAASFMEALISSTAGSRVRTSALHARERDWQESEAACIGSFTGSSPSASLPSSSSKIRRASEPADLNKWSGHLPASGMTVGGLLYQPKRLEPRTSANAGSFLPTLSASSYGNNRGGSAGRSGKIRPSLQTMARKNLWPTLTRRDAESIKKLTRGKNAGPGGTPLPVAIGGPLNPEWAEWFMNYPIGWTESADWAIRSCPSKRESRSKGSSESPTIPKKPILDACCGSRMFWFDKANLQTSKTIWMAFMKLERKDFF